MHNIPNTSPLHTPPSIQNKGVTKTKHYYHTIQHTLPTQHIAASRNQTSSPSFLPSLPERRHVAKRRGCFLCKDGSLLLFVYIWGEQCFEEGQNGTLRPGYCIVAFVRSNIYDCFFMNTPKKTTTLILHRTCSIGLHLFVASLWWIQYCSSSMVLGLCHETIICMLFRIHCR